MITTLKPYPAYKDSGVPWLGELPAHWVVRRLKQVARLNPSKAEARALLEQDAPVTFLPMERVHADGRIEVTEHLPISSVWNGFTYFRRGDVIVAKITPCFENGKGACLDTLPTEVGFGSTEFHVLRAGNSMRAPFLYRVTTLPDFRRLGADEMTGAAGQQRVPESFIANFTVPCPPLPEQAAIVRFLDWADRRIRRVMRARRRRIKLLEEYKQALIHQVVTGRIDVCTGQPYPSYKDSGVEWLGKVPEHWEVLRLKYVARLRSGESITSERIEETGDYPVYGGNGIRGFTSSFTHEGEFVLIGRQGALCGNINYANGRFWASEHAVVVHPLRKCLTHWLGELLRAMNLNQYSIAAAQPGLAVERIQNLAIPFPPIDEQEQIDQYIKNQLNAFDAAIAADRRSIELLQEFRTRLIADVVTGKLDVREAAAKLPDEPPEEEDEVTEDEGTNEGGEAPADAELGAVTEEAEP